MKKTLISLLIISSVLIPVGAYAQVSTQGGGTGSTSPSGILYGDGTLHLKTLGIGPGCTITGGTLSCPGTGITGTQGQDVYIGAGGTAIATSSLFIAPNGYVGIGSTSPNALLSLLVGSDYGPHPSGPILQIGSSTAGVATSTLLTLNSTAGAFNTLQITGGVDVMGAGSSFFLSTTNTGLAWQNSFSYIHGDGSSVSPTTANFLSFATDATERLHITGTGFVGIATSSPTVPLAIAGTPNAAPGGGELEILNTQTPLQSWMFRLDSTQEDLAIDAGGGTGYFEAMRLNRINGNVGLGSTSPYAKLSIMAGSSATPYGSQAASTAFAIGSSTAGTATSTLFDVLSSGFVGIGTTTPNAALVVAGTYGSELQVGSLGQSGRIDFIRGSDGTAHMWIGAGAAGSTGDLSIVANNGTPNIILDAANTNGTDHFQVNNADIAIVNPTGLGIGTTSPYANLSIMAGSPATPYASQGLTTAFAIGSSTAGTATSTLFAITSGGQVQGVLGGPASTPTYSFFGSTGTGMRAAANNDLRLTVGGTDEFRSAGNQEGFLNLAISAGLNTVSPTNGLYVQGSVAVGTTSPNARVDIAGVNNATVPLFQLSSVVAFATTTQFIVLNNGNVGIASTSPYALFSVGTGSGVGIGFTAATSTWTTTGGLNINSGCYALQGTCIGSGGGSNYFTNSGISTYLSTGINLGIGTTTPMSLLSIASSTASTIFSAWEATSTLTGATTTTYSSSGTFTYTIPTGTVSLSVTVVGAGGGGGNSGIGNNAGGGGGGSSAFGTIVCGAGGGGAANVVTSAATGGDGGGGTGGTSTSGASGAGGAGGASVASTTIAVAQLGGIGSTVTVIVGAAGGGNTGTITNGTGGAGYFNGAQAPSQGEGGGGGGCTGSASGNHTGGTGASFGGSVSSGGTAVSNGNGGNSGLGSGGGTKGSTAGTLGGGGGGGSGTTTGFAGGAGEVIITTTTVAIKGTNLVPAFTITALAGTITSNATSSPAIGIASSTPAGTLGLESAWGSVIEMLGSVINGVHYVVFEIDQYGHAITGGPTPSISGGTSTVAGNDNNGTITVTGSALTSVTLTFANAWATAPDCTESDNSTAITADISSISTTQMVLGFSIGINSGTIWYQCVGAQ